MIGIRQWQNFAGPYTLVCSLNSGWTPGATPLPAYVDGNGAPIPAPLALGPDGRPRPGVFQIARLP
jgi:hypothetical protein